jgi:GNAT superfamily N-acetyltransferase
VLDRPMTPCLVRVAIADDAPAAVAVLRASITQLCIEDHQNDRPTLERWLRNKTTEQFCQWAADPAKVVLVAEVATVLCGVGAMRTTGDLDLCYVQPGRQRSGVGRALLYACEAQARKWGLKQLQLISTATARSFYERHGYLSVGEASVRGYGVLRDYYYVKALAAEGAV